ncbi:MAG: PadR family transcriptional regulator [Candidatus Micrarchaeia archaeon]
MIDEEDDVRGPRRGMRGGMGREGRGIGGRGHGQGMRGPGMHGAGMHHYGMHFGRRGALRPLIISMLSELPRNGPELMDAIENIYGWRPSPGSIYPILDELESEGIIEKKDEKYRLTGNAQDNTDWPFGFGRPATTFDIIERIDMWLDYFEKMKSRDPNSFKAYSEKLSQMRDKMNRLVGSGTT